MPNKKEYHPPELHKNKFPLARYLDHPKESPPVERLIKYVVVRALLLSESKQLILARRPKSSTQAPELWSYIGGKVDLLYPSSTGTALVQTSEVTEIEFSKREWTKVWGESLNRALLRELDEELTVVGDQQHTLAQSLSAPTTVDAYHANQTLTVIIKATIPDDLVPQLRLSPKPVTEQMTNLQVFSVDLVPIENMAFEYAGDFLIYLQQSSPEIIPIVIKNAVLRINVLVKNLPVNIMTQLVDDATPKSNQELFLNFNQAYTQLGQLLQQLWGNYDSQPDPVISLGEAANLITDIKVSYERFMNSEDTDLTQFDEVYARLTRLSKAVMRLITLKT